MINRQIAALRAAHKWLDLLAEWPLFGETALQVACGAAADVPPGPRGIPPGARVQVVSVTKGFEVFADTVVELQTPFTDHQTSFVQELTDNLPAGLLLDAGCGTGRQARHLHPKHEIIGVDISPDMLHRASVALPFGRWIQGDLKRLPLPTPELPTVDALVSAYAIGHVAPAELPLVIAEFKRVTRQGGRIIICDVHPTAVSHGAHLLIPTDDTDHGTNYLAVRRYPHPLSAYWQAFQRNGLRVNHLREVFYRRGAPEHELATDDEAQGPTLEGRPVLLGWDLTVL